MSRQLTLREIEAILAREGLSAHSMEEAVYDSVTSTDIRVGESGEFSVFDSHSEGDSLDEIVDRDRILAANIHAVLEEDPADACEGDLGSDDPLDGWGDLLAAL